ncbi:MAG: cation:proton antiporter [Methanoregula sp.]|nr:cation:proton antiporter [Methanoregula sp.]
MEMMLAIVILISLAIALLYIGQHFKLPSIVSFLIIGILVGPFGFALITNQSAIEMVGQIGIILLLFTIGLEFSFEKLLRSWRIVIIGGLVQVCTTIVAITLITTYFKMPFNEALVFGFIVSLSSTAIVMKILQERGELDTLQGRTLLGILIFQDLAIIPMILITPLLVSSGGPDLDQLPMQMGKVAGLLIIIIIMAKWIIPAFLFRVVRLRNRELFFITIAGICVLIAWFTSEAGLSVTLGAFVAGLIIGESDYNIDALSHIIPFRDVFAAIFFLSIGMLLDTRMVLNNMYWVVFIVLIIIGVKFMTGAFAAAVLGMPARVCIFAGFSLCQIGEFSFVLAHSGLDSKLIPIEVYQLFLAGAIITMAFTPFAMNASPKTVDILYRLFPRRLSGNDTANDTNDNGRPLSDHIIIAGYGVTGKSVARAAELTGIPYVVIDLNPEIIKQEKAKRRTHVIFGDAVQEEILEHAGIRKARTLVVVVSEELAIPRIVYRARTMSPSVYIIARTRHIRHAKKLLDLGADEVVSEEFEAAREIFSRALRKYQFPEAEIIKIVDRLQSWGYGKFIKSAEAEQQVSGMETMLHSLRIHTIFVEPGSTAAGKTLGELELKNRFGIMDYGFRREGKTIMQPNDTISLQEGDALIIFASDERCEEIRPLFYGG